MATRRSDKLAEAIVDRDARNRADRATWESVWQEIARYMLPSEATFTEEIQPGVQRNRTILDSTAARSLELFASFLHTLLNNPSLQWFKVNPVGVDATKLGAEWQRWLEAVQRTMLAHMAGRSANLYANLHSVYLGLGGFGTAVLYAEGANASLRTRQFHLDDVTIEEDASGFVDVVFRRTPFTPRQAKQRWSGLELEDLGGAFVKQGRKDPVRIIHAVVPTSDEDLMRHMKARDRRRAEMSPYASVWLNAEDRVTIQVGGYEEFPYMVPRWYKTRGEVYGRSPGMTVLPDARMVNRMMETILRGAEKLVDPPLVVRDGSLVSPVRIFSGGITFTEGDAKIEPLIPPGASRIEYGQELLMSRQSAIREGFFVPLFATPDSPVKTATQVLQEVDERNRAISPMIVRMHEELFHRLIARVFGVLSRGGLLPAPPDDRDFELDIQYVSPLSASQQQMEALGTLRIIEGALPWAQTDPAAMDVFDANEVMKVIHAGSGAPASILRSAADVKRLRDARNKQEMAAGALEKLIPAVEAGAKVRGADAAMLKAQKA